MGKSRLSPLKLLTIPQLELSAAVVAARLDKVIRTETDIDVDDSVFWTDSTWDTSQESWALSEEALLKNSWWL